MKDFIVQLPAMLVVITMICTFAIGLSAGFVEYSEEQYRQFLASAGLALSPVLVCAILGLFWAAASWAKIFHDVANP